CIGCVAAAQWIEQLGLSDYYRLRSAPAQRPDAFDVDKAQVWKFPEVASHVVRELGAGRQESVMFVEGLRCSGCVWLIERMLTAMPGVTTVRINASACRAHLVWESARVSLSDLVARLAHAGYRGVPLDAAALNDARRREMRDATKRLGVAGLGAM